MDVFVNFEVNVCKIVEFIGGFDVCKMVEVVDFDFYWNCVVF